MITFYLESKAANYIATLSSSSNYAESPYVAYNTKKKEQLNIKPVNNHQHKNILEDNGLYEQPTSMPVVATNDSSSSSNNSSNSRHNHHIPSSTSHQSAQETYDTPSSNNSVSPAGTVAAQQYKEAGLQHRRRHKHKSRYSALYMEKELFPLFKNFSLMI